jgi:NADH-quinone oxidoreductase subunit J
MITFWLLAAILICSAVFVVTARKPVHAVVGLLANFIALAAAYLTLSAEFLAVAQILVYSGAILILFLFVIALLSSGIEALDLGKDRLSKIPGAVLLSLVVTLVAIVSAAARSTLGPPTVTVNDATGLSVGSNNAFGSVNDFGAALFTTYLLPFELTALVLLVAIIGVVMITGEREGLALPPRPRRRSMGRPREPILPGGNR